MTLLFICVMGLGSMVLLCVSKLLNDFIDHLCHRHGFYGFTICFVLSNDFTNHLRHGLGSNGFTMCFCTFK